MPRHAGAVVGVEEHDRLVGEPVLFQLVEEALNVLIHNGDAVVEPGYRPAHDRSVRVVRWQRDGFGIADRLLRKSGLDVLLENRIGPDHRA